MGYKYYVASSTCAMFDPDSRVDNFQAAMLDYAANSTIELYEYMKMFYTNARLHDIRLLLKWCEDSGYFNQMGRVTSSFYSAATFDPTTVADAIRVDVSVPEGASFQVQSSSLDYFSEHTWIKYIATKQGKADLFYEGTYEAYDLEFPTSTTIRAVFSNGATVEGTLPTHTQSTRFLNVEYSIIAPEQIPIYDEDGNPIVDETTGEPVTATQNTYNFGYYCYPENSGNAALDALIATQNSATGNATFYPAVPLRTDTSWFDGTDAEYIGKILQKIRLYDPAEEAKGCYWKLVSSLSKAIVKGGNKLSDIDYITLLLGCSINSTHKVDLSYIYGFFKSLYDGYDARFPKHEDIILRGFIGNWKGWLQKILNNRSGSFVVNNGRSNLDLKYSWSNIFEGECNGKWKPGAVIGTYGVLVGSFSREESTVQPKRNEAGQIIYSQNKDEDGAFEPVYEVVTTVKSYGGVLFCHQKGEDLIEYVGFTDLKLVNNVYDGHTVDTYAYDAIMESSQLGTVELEADDKTTSTFYYVKYQGDESAFIVPLEQTSLYSRSIKDQLDLTYGCTYLVINCWVKVKKKKKWQNVVRAVICFTGAVILTPIAPLLSSVLYFASGVFFTAAALELSQKILCTIFGEKLGNTIYNFVIQIIKTVLIYIATVAFKLGPIGWIVWGICMAVYATITMAEYLNAGYSIQEAFKRGAIETSIAGLGTLAGGYVGGTAGLAISNGTAAAGSSYANGESVGTALQRGAIAGGSYYIGSSIGGVAGKAVGAGLQGTGNALVDGSSFKDSLKVGGISAGFSLAMSGASAGYNYISNSLDNTSASAPNANSSNIASTLNEGPKNSGLTMSSDGKTFDFLGETYDTPTNAGQAVLIAGQLVSQATLQAFMGALRNPMTYVNLMSMTLAERQFHKIANISNDYQEFNNRYKAVMEVMDMMNQLNNSSMTAEFLCKIQAALGRFSDLFPDATVMDPDEWLSMAVTTGHDQLKAVMLGPSTFVDSRLSMDGYEPYQLYYTVMDFDGMFTEEPYLPYL